jgi:hypothetical protein
MGGGSATLICDCQQALRRALKTGPAGIKTATQDEYDLILYIHQLYNQLKT